MPPLAGIVDLTDDPRLQHQLATSIGQGIGGFIRNRREYQEAERLRQEEQHRQETDAQIVKTIHEARQNGLGATETLGVLMGIPGFMETQWAQESAARFISGANRSQYTTPPWWMEHLPQDQQAQAAVRASGLPDPNTDAKKQIELIQKVNDLRAMIRNRERLLQQNTDDQGQPMDSATQRQIEGELRDLRYEQEQLLAQSPDDIRKRYRRVDSAIDLHYRTMDAQKAFPLSSALKQLDKSKWNADGVKAALIQYARTLADQWDLPLSEASHAADRQYRRLIEDNYKLGWFTPLPKGITISAADLSPTKKFGITDPLADAGVPEYVRQMHQQGASTATITAATTAIEDEPTVEQMLEVLDDASRKQFQEIMENRSDADKQEALQRLKDYYATIRRHFK